MPDITSEELCTAYEGQIAAQEAFTASLVVLCKTILEANEIEVAAIDARTKSMASFREKISRADKIGRYGSISDITDLSGVRIILFLKEDCDRAITCLSKEMRVDEENSTDKNFADDPDRFGYTSRHLVVSHSTARSKLTEYKTHVGLKAEIQIRTVLQHAWATIDWRLRYKSKKEVPTPIRRRLYRISALLESADDAFSTIEAQVNQLREDYKEKLATESSDIELNGESLKVYLEEDRQWLAIKSSLEANGLKFFIASKGQPLRLSLSLELLERAGYKSIGQIKADVAASRKNIEDAVLFAASTSEGNTKRTISSEGVLRIAIIVANKDRQEELLPHIRLNSVFVERLQQFLK